MTKIPFHSNILFDIISERVFALAMQANLFPRVTRTKNVQICVRKAHTGADTGTGVRLALQLLSQITLSNRGLRGIRPQI